jgi:hypothetical protein
MCQPGFPYALTNIRAVLGDVGRSRSGSRRPHSIDRRRTLIHLMNAKQVEMVDHECAEQNDAPSKPERH